MPVSRRDFLRGIGVAGAALATGGLTGAQQERRRPNILYVMTDQQPASCAGPYTDGPLRTPNLDDLARGGCTFGNMYIAAFPCSPSRACQLTGRYLHHHRVVQNDVMFDADVPSLGDICSAAGYDTGYFGKWHLGGNMYRGRDDSRARGLGGNWYFERSETEGGWRCKAVPGGVGEDASQHGFRVWAGGWEQYHAWLRSIGQGQYLEEFPGLGNHNDAPATPEGQHMYSQLHEDHHMAAFFAGEAERFVRERAGGARPWAAVLSFFGPHLPVAPPKPWDEMYSLDQVTLPANHRDSLAGKPVRQRTAARNYVLPEWTDDQFKDYIRRYWGYCSYLDRQIGRVFAALRDTGQWDNTIVVFTSDHGDMLAGHGMIFKLGTCGYEELYRVPTLVRIPGVTRPGSRTDALASNVDFVPTLVEAAGLAAPDGMDGLSLVPLLRSERDTHRDIIFSDCSDSSLICRDKQHKFVLNWRNRDIDELYDLDADPGEMRNLAYEDAHKATADALRARVLDWTRDTTHRYAALVATEAAKQPATRVLELRGEVRRFKYLGGNEFEMEIVWHVDKPLGVTEGKYWAFTQFVNPKYGQDGDIVFRFTPWPEPPFTEWEAGKEYRIGPVKVQVPDHAGPGDYQVRTGLWDPETHKGPGVILSGQGNAVIIGTLTIKREDGKITEISYQAK